jgi:hypothetical protein
MSQIIFLNEVTVSFAQNLFIPKAITNADGSQGAPKYSGVFILEPNGPHAKLIEDTMVAVAKDRWLAKAPGILAKLEADGRVALKRKAMTDSDGQVYNGFEGKWYISANNAKQPLVIGRSISDIIRKEDGKVYSGATVNAKIEIWAQDDRDPVIGKRINAQLVAVQFVRHGKRLDGAQDPTTEGFEDLGPDPDEEQFEDQDEERFA